MKYYNGEAVLFTKYRRLIILLWLIFFIVGFSPPTKAATTSSINYNNDISYQSQSFDVTASFTLELSCTSNWQYWPGLTEDTLTAELQFDSLKLKREGKTLSYSKIIGETEQLHFKTKEWTERNYKIDPRTGQGYYDYHTYKREYFAQIRGEAFGSIVYSGDLNSISRNSLHWSSSSTQDVTVSTKASLLGNASIKARVDEYRIRIRIITNTYRDGSSDASTKTGEYSGWFTIGSEPSEYAEIVMSNMGVGFFLLVALAIGVVVSLILFITKRQVEIVSPEKYETGRVVIPSKEKGPPSEELEPFTEELGPPSEELETSIEELGPPRELEELGPPRELEKSKIPREPEKLKDIYCPSCGSLNPPGREFCEVCGASFIQ